MSDITTTLRTVCGHDSHSVAGCLNCEAADEIETLRERPRHANDCPCTCLPLGNVRAAPRPEWASWSQSDRGGVE